MSEHIEQAARDTPTLVRLPFPVGHTDLWTEIGIDRRYEDLPEDGLTPQQITEQWGEAGYPNSGIDVTIGTAGDWDYYFEKSFEGDADGKGSGYRDNNGGTVIFPSFGAVIAFLLLGQFSSEGYLLLSEPASQQWDTLRRARWARKEKNSVEQANSDAEEAAEIADALTAHMLLDAETRRLVGKGFDELLDEGVPRAIG